jgi:hypothetical protein
MLINIGAADRAEARLLVIWNFGRLRQFSEHLWHEHVEAVSRREDALAFVDGFGICRESRASHADEHDCRP